MFFFFFFYIRSLIVYLTTCISLIYILLLIYKLVSYKLYKRDLLFVPFNNIQIVEKFLNTFKAFETTLCKL